MARKPGNAKRVLSILAGLKGEEPSDLLTLPEDEIEPEPLVASTPAAAAKLRARQGAWRGSRGGPSLQELLNPRV